MIDSNILDLLEILEDKGYEAYIVGGAVRDKLLGKDSKDIDITTNASSNTIKQLFSFYPLFDIGKNLGTVTVLVDDYKVDITPFRKDGEYKNHRRPNDIIAADNLKEDLLRRDFTINALCIDKDEKIIDYFNGLEDLNNKIIRCVGNPNRRFNEDSLRILRAIRFKAVLNFNIEEETNKAIFANKDLLTYISSERKKEELLKTLSCENAYSIIETYNDVFSTFITLSNNKNIDKFNSPFFKLAYMNVDKNTLKQLTFSKHEINLISALKNTLSIDINSDYQLVKVLSEKIYYQDIILFLEELYDINLNERINRLKEYIVNENDLVINGHQLAEYGYKDKEIKEIKKELVELINRQKLHNSLDEIKDYLSTK